MNDHTASNRNPSTHVLRSSEPLSPYFKILFAAVCFLVASCIGPGSLPPKMIDQRVGNQASSAVWSQIGVLDTPELTQYLQNISDRLLPHIPNRQFNYRVQLVDQAEPNAFSTPGGYVYFSRGLLVLAANEDEIAGVMAHEMMHVERRHGIKQARGRALPKLLAIPGNIVGNVINEDLGKLLILPGAKVRASVGASYSRSHEYEADEFGQAVVAAAGYDPSGLVTMLNRIEQAVELERGEERSPSIFDTHPTTVKRSLQLDKRAESLDWTPVSAIAGSVNAFYTLWEGLIIGTNAARGVLVDGDFLHPDAGFRIRFPEEWTPFNFTTIIGAVAPERDAVITLEHLGEGGDPVAIGKGFAETLERQYEEKPVRAEMIEFNGVDSFIVELKDDSGRTDSHLYRFWTKLDGTLYRMSAIGTSARHESLKTAAQSFRTIESPERERVYQTQLSVSKALEGETLAAFSKRNGNSLSMEKLLLLNNMDSEKALEEGQMLKFARTSLYAGEASQE